MIRSILPRFSTHLIWLVRICQYMSFIRWCFFLVVTDCALNNVRRVFYRFSYSSADNTISAVDVYLMLEVPAPTTRVSTRITIEWNDIASNAAASTTIPRTNSLRVLRAVLHTSRCRWLSGWGSTSFSSQRRQFRRVHFESKYILSVLLILSTYLNVSPGSSGLCVDAQRQSLRYKKSISSSCLVQIQRQNIQQCHNLK